MPRDIKFRRDLRNAVSTHNVGSDARRIFFHTNAEFADLSLRFAVTSISSAKKVRKIMRDTECRSGGMPIAVFQAPDDIQGSAQW